MPGQKVEEPGSMDWETGFLCLANSSRGLAMVLANKNNPATPGTCEGGDAIALGMTLEADFPRVVVRVQASCACAGELHEHAHGGFMSNHWK